MTTILPSGTSEFHFFYIPNNGRTYQSFPVCLNSLTMIFSTFIQVVPSETNLHNCLQESCYWTNKSLSQAIKIIKCKESRKPKVKPSQRTCLKFLEKASCSKSQSSSCPISSLFISTLTRNREGGDPQLRESSHSLPQPPPQLALHMDDLWIQIITKYTCLTDRSFAILILIGII